MASSYDLGQLDANSFESMVNFLAMRVLGNGVTGFAAGADGGRDGYLEGAAPYPSAKNSWSGIWFIQSKFHKPHLSTNSQSWLYQQVLEEVKKFPDRKIPNIWIIATNIEPSGNPETGAYDKIKELIKSELPADLKFDIWGGRKILDFLAADPTVASYYGHFLTPGNVLTSLYESIGDQFSQTKAIVDHLVVSQFKEQTYTKLEQAGSAAVTRPKIHELFVDLPFRCEERTSGAILETLVASAASNHKFSVWADDPERGSKFSKALRRSRIFILKGGPGQGKSTVGQFFSQIQRAALILSADGPTVIRSDREIASSLKTVAEALGLWTDAPRIPVLIELKDFATWYGSRGEFETKGVLSYLADRISQKTEQDVLTGTLKRLIAHRSWFFNFDGLDEVPNDVKDDISAAIIKFSDEMLPSLDADALILCTTRPQGYSGQFDKLESATAVLSKLPRKIAMQCAMALVKFERSESECEDAFSTLQSAMESPQVRDLMTTPLQSHIMAIVVRDGGRPPERRWELFENFYKVMKKREAQKNFQDQRINKLLREGDALLKAIHTRLGVALHAQAESSKGAEATLDKAEFNSLCKNTVNLLMETNIDSTVAAVREATTERLVFVNTPDNSNSVRFDIRQLQEFFAGEFIYSEVSPATMRSRIETICADAHWREVMHFVMSALIVNGRRTELVIATEVLTSTDSGGGCHNNRIFRRRMATGALMALRLISEGVVEQDRRVRLNFTNALHPLYALLNRDVTLELANISHENSAIWLQASMIDYLFEASEEEQIGAAIALTRSLPDDHEEVERVKNRLARSSGKYLSAIIKAHLDARRPGFDPNEKVSVKTWFLSVVIDLLKLKEHKPGLDYIVAIDLLRENKVALLHTLAFALLSTTERQILSALVHEEKFDIDAKSPNSAARYRGIKFTRFTHDWQSPDLPQEILFDVGNLSELSPFLAYSGAAIKLAQDLSFENLKAFIAIAENFPDPDTILPNYLCGLLPFDFWGNEYRGFARRLAGLDEQVYLNLIRTGKLAGRNLRPTARIITIEGEFTAQSWKSLLRDHPGLGAHLALQRRVDTTANATKAMQNSLVELAFSNPSVFSPLIIHWGDLFTMAGDREAELRQHFVEYFDEQWIQENGVRSAGGRISNLKISLDQELAWLPMLAAALTPSFMQNGLLRRRNLKNTEPEDVFEKLGLSNEQLESILRSNSVDILYRQAALVCYFSLALLSKANPLECIFTSGIAAIVLDLLVPDSPQWVLGSFVTYAERELSTEDSRVAILIGTLLNTFRDDYESSCVLQNAFVNWRERSAAPVNKAGCLELWLAQEE